jgi:uncharacterized protein (TIGR00296 family)
VRNFVGVLLGFRRELEVTYLLNNDEGSFIVRFARNVIERKLGISAITIYQEIPDKLKEKSGVFITINKLIKGEAHLRGCIGFPFPVKSLFEAIESAAISAAFNDPRFPPVSASEMKDILIEVSVLTPPMEIRVNNPLRYPEKVDIGKDGLIIERGYKRGLLLPQVAVDWNWDSQEFLTQCCLKAGLPPDAWLLNGTKVSKFQAIIFIEKEPKGQIKRHNLIK